MKRPEPIPGEAISEEDLTGKDRAYFLNLMHVFKGRGLSYDERRRVSLAKVKDRLDREARKALEEKRQLKLF